MNGIYRSNAIPIREMILKFISKDKEIKIIKTSLKKINLKDPHYLVLTLIIIKVS